MTYINDKDFVHRVFHTIEKQVYDQTMRSKLHEYFTKNLHRLNYDLFLPFSRTIGEIKKNYNNDNIKFSNSFILVLLTFLKESSDVFQRDTDVVKIFIDRFMKRTDSELVVITTDYCNHGFECLRFLASELNIYIGTSNNVDDRIIRNRSNYYNFRRNSSNSSDRRERSRSNDNVPPRSNNPNTVYASHVTQEARMEIERQRALPPVVQQNTDAVVARLVQDNHSLYAAIKERDNTIIDLQNQIARLRENRNF